jgi:hypothetical protein
LHNFTCRGFGISTLNIEAIFATLGPESLITDIPALPGAVESAKIFLGLELNIAISDIYYLHINTSINSYNET